MIDNLVISAPEAIPSDLISARHEAGTIIVSFQDGKVVRFPTGERLRQRGVDNRHNWPRP